MNHLEVGSPAHLSGLKVGDQILTVGGFKVSGDSVDRAYEVIKRTVNQGSCQVTALDRPHCHTVTVYKDQRGRLGFVLTNGKVTSLDQNSPAGNSGLQMGQSILDINGQCVARLTDAQRVRVIEQGGNAISLTVIPGHIYDHLMRPQ